MDDADAERIRAKSSHDRMKCASCGCNPTCPQLRDDLWESAWRCFVALHSEGQMPMRDIRCTCATDIGRHAAGCEQVTLTPRALLCLECAERALGRELALADLQPCVGNYAHYVMQVRAEVGAIQSSIQREVLHALETYDGREDTPLAEAELGQLWRLDGPPPSDPVSLSRSVQGYAIRAVREIRRSREKLEVVRDLAARAEEVKLGESPSLTPYVGRVVYADDIEDALK